MNNTYYSLGEDGGLLSTLTISAEEASLQARVTDVEPPSAEGMRPFFVDGSWELRPIEVAQPNACEMRKMSYPPIKEQLDMLWHAMDRGDIPVAQSFYEALKSVKDMYPIDQPTFEVGPMPEA